MQAGEPAQPVQQSVVIARMRGLFLRWALPSPTDIGQCFSTMSKMSTSSSSVMSNETLTQSFEFTQSLKHQAKEVFDFNIDECDTSQWIVAKSASLKSG